MSQPGTGGSDMHILIDLAGVTALAAVAAVVVLLLAATWAGTYGPPSCYIRLVQGMGLAAAVFLVAWAALYAQVGL